MPPISSALQRSLFQLSTAALFALTACGGGGGGSASSAVAPIGAVAAVATPAPVNNSRVSSFKVSSTTQLSTFAGVVYSRVVGVVSGTIDPTEAIVGVKLQTLGTDKLYHYTAEFEVVAPAASQPANQGIVVEGENRGSGVALSELNNFGGQNVPSASTYPASLGNGFLEKHGLSYARVQWQNGIAAGVPVNAQGVGLAIVRDFGRLLAGRFGDLRSSDNISLGAYSHRILTGVSQGAWLVNTVIAEGFNADPLTGTGVYDGAIAIDGTGNWLAINMLGNNAGAAQTPYLVQNGLPLLPIQLLRRPASDPAYIDTANSTDFFRLRASLTDTPTGTPNYWRYDWPSPHAVASVPAAGQLSGVGTCNNGVAIALNPVSYFPYYRAIVLGLARQLGVTSAASAPALPPTSTFTLDPTIAVSPFVNGIDGITVQIPALDADGQPQGGVRFPDADVPVGQSYPPALQPVSTASINATCGNSAGFQTLKNSVVTRYGSESTYLSNYQLRLQSLIAGGYILPEDSTTMMSAAKSIFEYQVSLNG